jgi:hypothetical protein
MKKITDYVENNAEDNLNKIFDSVKWSDYEKKVN